MNSYPKILFKYLIKLHLKSIFLIFLIFFILIFFIDLIELYRRSANKIDLLNKEHTIFLELIFMSFLKGPNVIQKILPLTILIASIITFIRWKQNNYFVIVRSVGISLWKLLIPICFRIFIIGLLSIIILNPLSSIFNKKYNSLENLFFGHNNEQHFSLNTKGLWIIKKDKEINYIINAQNISKNRNTLSKVTVFKFNKTNMFDSKIFAESGIIKNDKLILKEGISFSRDYNPKKFNSFVLISEYESKNFKFISEKPENLDFISLYNYIKLMNVSGLNISNHLIYFLKILCQPVLMISMVLISASLILKNNERKFPISIISLTLIIGFIIYFLADLILALGSMEKINPFLAGLGPTMISFLSGCFLVSSFDEIKENGD